MPVSDLHAVRFGITIGRTGKWFIRRPSIVGPLHVSNLECTHLLSRDFLFNEGFLSILTLQMFISSYRGLFEWQSYKCSAA